MHGSEGQDLSAKLERLDYAVVEYALGCINKEPVVRSNRWIGGRLPRHLKMAKLPDWLQRIRMRLKSLKRRLEERARQERLDPLAVEDPRRFQHFRNRNKSPQDMSKEDVHKHWDLLCNRRRRKIPVPKSGLLPILAEKDPRVRDAGIKWYCGSFPGNPDLLQLRIGNEAYHTHKTRLETGLSLKSWSTRMRTMTTESLRAFLEGLEQQQIAGRKRTREEDSEATNARKRRK